MVKNNAVSLLGGWQQKNYDINSKCCWKMNLLAVWIGVSGWKAKSNYHNLSPICLVNEDVGFAPKSPKPGLIVQLPNCISCISDPFVQFQSNEQIHLSLRYLNSVFKATLHILYWAMSYICIYTLCKRSQTIGRALCLPPRNTSRPYQENAESARRSRITH